MIRPVRELERAMILAPERWPQWPRLPLTRRNSDAAEDVGYLVAGLGLQVFLGNIFDLPATPNVERFVTIDELLMQWRID
jgi:hypothetical protein